MHTFDLVLEKSPLFRGVSNDEFTSIFDCLGAHCKQYEKNELIFRAGEPAHLVGVICSGSAQVIQEDFMGNRAILARLEAGDLFGESVAFSRDLPLPVSVEALQTVDVMLFDFSRILHSCPGSCPAHLLLIENMLQILALKNLLLNQKVEILSRRSTRDKLIAYLSVEAKKAGPVSGGSSKERSPVHFTIPFNRQELADYLCVDRSAMSSELSRLKAEGVLSYQKNEFTLFSL